MRLHEMAKQAYKQHQENVARCAAEARASNERIARATFKRFFGIEPEWVGTDDEGVFAEEDDIKLYFDTTEGYAYLLIECPSCKELCQSHDIMGLEQLGEILDNPEPSWGHYCNKQQ